MAKRTIAAVVPVYNSAKYIAQTLQTIMRQSRKFDEIIVVDDGSTDDTVKIVKKFPVKVLQLQHQERSATRNAGWRHAKSEIVAIMESDAFFDKDWVKNVLKGFDQGYEAVIDARRMYKPKTLIAKMNDHFFVLRYKKYVPFSAWVFTRSLLEELNGFDVKLMGPEDRELGDRILASGRKIYFARDAVQYHMGEPYNWRGSLRRSFFYGSRMISYWKKTRKIQYPKLVFFSVMWLSLFLAWWIFVGMFVLYAGYIFMRDAMRGMQWKYLALHPVYVTINELVFFLGALYGVVFGQAKKVR